MKKLVACLAVAMTLAACGGWDNGEEETDSSTYMQGADAGTTMNHDTMEMQAGAMQGNMEQEMTAMNASMVQHLGAGDSLYDQRFIDMMIPHHEGAVMMATDALEKASRPELRRLAQGIVDAQQKEIAMLRDWRMKWYGSAESSGMGEMMGHMNMMNRNMVQSLGAKDSMYEDRFIDMMIPHHQGAIMMARDAIKSAQHPELTNLAEKIISDLEREIQQMTAWRSEWYGH